MVIVEYHPGFQKLFSKIKDASTKEKIIKQLKKLRIDPELGKPMRFGRKGTRELYIPPFRLSYTYIKEDDRLILLDLYHKNEQ